MRQLQQTVDSKGAQKMSVFVGSYDTFLSFFGLANLTDASPDFKGLPAYASILVFELFTETNMTSFPSNTDDLIVHTFPVQERDRLCLDSIPNLRS